MSEEGVKLLVQLSREKTEQKTVLFDFLLENYY